MTPETRAALALVDAGLPADQVDRVLRMLDVDYADSAEAIAEKVSGLTAELPALFGTGTGQPGGLGVAGGADRYAGKTLEQLGQEGAAARGWAARTPQERAHERFKSMYGRPPGGGDAA